MAHTRWRGAGCSKPGVDRVAHQWEASCSPRGACFRLFSQALHVLHPPARPRALLSGFRRAEYLAHCPVLRLPHPCRQHPGVVDLGEHNRYIPGIVLYIIISYISYIYCILYIYAHGLRHVSGGLASFTSALLVLPGAIVVIAHNGHKRHISPRLHTII